MRLVHVFVDVERLDSLCHLLKRGLLAQTQRTKFLRLEVGNFVQEPGQERLPIVSRSSLEVTQILRCKNNAGAKLTALK